MCASCLDWVELWLTGNLQEARGRGQTRPRLGASWAARLCRRTSLPQQSGRASSLSQEAPASQVGQALLTLQFLALRLSGQGHSKHRLPALRGHMGKHARSLEGPCPLQALEVPGNHDSHLPQSSRQLQAATAEQPQHQLLKTWGCRPACLCWTPRTWMSWLRQRSSRPSIAQ